MIMNKQRRDEDEDEEQERDINAQEIAYNVKNTQRIENEHTSI